MSVKLEHLFSLSVLLSFSLVVSLSISTPVNPDAAVLLSFKSTSDPSNSLSSWSNSTSDPCSWLGVTCNPLTRRVIKLVLNELNLTGSIDALTPLTQLRHLSLHHNSLSSVPKNFTFWPNLKHLYLSHNLIAGNFPDGISSLHRLRRLDLSHNRFSGEIPLSELTQLPHLLTLRLEFNSFTGTLHSGELSSTSISDFNVSGNNLVGKIPNWLSYFPDTSFAENKNLCGDPLPYDCPTGTVPSNRTARGEAQQIKSRKGISNRVVLMIVGIDAVVVVAVLVTLTCCCYKRGYLYTQRKREAQNNYNMYNGKGSRENETMVYFEGRRGFTKVDDLLKGSAEMLGRGNVGTTYKVVVDGGDVVVVKRVKERRRRKEFAGFLMEIGGLRHPNIVSLRACYSSKDELLLVYDFLPGGSLHYLLHGNRGPGRTPLDWTKRLKLASGSAQGLAFLHSYKKSKLFHGHLTTSNIIVDHLGNACLSDVGLHQLLPEPAPATGAYNPPELLAGNNGGGNINHNTKFMQKCDVYSFGVVLLEILTGKMATSEGETSLARWVQRMVTVPENNWTWDVLDFELLMFKEEEEEMMALLRVALLCLAASPRDRPNMAAVHEMIENISISVGGRGGTTGFPANYVSSDSSLAPSESTPNFTSS
ncbi:Non-specific serine/threonine protein kinase [Bertholletia excelsa]